MEGPANGDPNRDQDTRKNPLDAAQQRQDERRRYAYELARDGLSAEAGLLPNSIEASRDAQDGDPDGKRKKEEERRFLRETLRIHREWLDRRIAFWEERRMELDRQISVLEDYLARLKQGEEPELDPHGRLQDKDLEKAIADYEKRTGETVDRLDPIMIQAVLDAAKDERDFATQRLDTLRRERDRAASLDPENPAHREKIERLEQSREGRIALDAASARALQAGDTETLHGIDRIRRETKDSTPEELAVLDEPDDLDALFADDPSRVSAAGAVEKSPISGPPLGQAFAEAGGITEAGKISEEAVSPEITTPAMPAGPDPVV